MLRREAADDYRYPDTMVEISKMAEICAREPLW